MRLLLVPIAPLLVLAACSSNSAAPLSDGDGGTAPDAGVDAGASESCQQIGGLHIVTSGGCSNGYSAAVLICVAQTGCALTVSTDTNVLTGAITGNAFTVTDPALQETCTGTVDASGAAQVECSAMGGAVTCSLTAEVDTAPSGYENTCCGFAKQDCEEGARCRPANVTGPLGTGYANLCYRAAGEVLAGGTCTRAEGVISVDNCAAPNACTKNGAPAGGLVCGVFCQGPSGCPVHQVCQRIIEAEPAGLCVQECDVFAAAPTCGAGLQCGMINAVMDSGAVEPTGMCIPAGTGVLGTRCNFQSDCAAGLDCFLGACHRFCDTAHVCKSNQTCIVWNNAPSSDPSFGACDPAN